MSKRKLIVPKHEQNLWKLDAQGYSVFGLYHNHEEWCVMRDHIIDGIVGLDLGRPARILDVGCGKGWNIQEIADTVLARTRQAPRIDIIEPDSYARGITEGLLIPSSYSGLLGKSFSDLNQVTDEKYDVILFMHSAYYIKKFGQQVERLTTNNLDRQGTIMVQTLPSSSPFFMGGKTYLPQTSEDVAPILANFGAVSVQRFPSHFLGEVFAANATDAGIENIKNFMDCARMTNRAFMKRFGSFGNAAGDVDLRDEIFWLKPEERALHAA